MVRIKEENKNVIVLSIVFFLISFLSVFVKNVDLNNYYTFIALTPFMVYSGNYIFQNRKKIIENKLLVFWLFFLLLVFISELQNGMIQDAPILFALTGIMCMFDFKMETLTKAMIIGITPIFIAALVAVSMSNKFSSNTIGIIVSILFVSNQIYYISTIASSTKKKSLSFFFIVTELLVFYVLFSINSRTSILIAVIASMVQIFHGLFNCKQKIINYYKKSNQFIKSIYLIIAIVIGIALVFISYKAVINIITPKWRPNDISTGRFEIWETTISNRTLFGHKYDWYSTSGLFGPHKGPHNMIIGVLGFAGIIPLILFVLIIVKTVYLLAKNYVVNPNAINIILILMFVTSNIKGLTESLIFQTSYQLYNIFFIIPLIFADKQSYENKSEVVNFKKKYLVASIIFFMAIMIVNIYGSVLNYNLDNILFIIKRYIK